MCFFKIENYRPYSSLAIISFILWFQIFLFVLFFLFLYLMKVDSSVNPHKERIYIGYRLYYSIIELVFWYRIPSSVRERSTKSFQFFFLSYFIVLIVCFSTWFELFIYLFHVVWLKSYKMIVNEYKLLIKKTTDTIRNNLYFTFNSLAPYEEYTVSFFLFSFQNCSIMFKLTFCVCR